MRNTKKNHHWSDNEVINLQELVRQRLNIPQLAVKLGMTPASIAGIIARSGMTYDTNIKEVPRVKYIEPVDEEADIPEMKRKGMSTEEIMAATGRHRQYVNMQLNKVGLGTGHKGTKTVWDVTKIQRLKTLYEDTLTPIEDIASELGVTSTAAYLKASRLGFSGYARRIKVHTDVKTCNNCQKELPLDKFGFYTSKGHGRQVPLPNCLSCRSAYSQRYKFGKVTGNGIVCYICGASNTCVDHDHKTGLVRGPLCKLCNSALGYFRDSPAALKQAIYYINNNATEFIKPAGVVSAFGQGCKTARDLAIYRVYKLLPSEVSSILDSQNGECAICKEQLAATGDTTRIQIDHNHDNNVIRGLLCYFCNTGLGRVKDDVNKLEALIDYLANPPGIGLATETKKAPSDVCPLLNYIPESLTTQEIEGKFGLRVFIVNDNNAVIYVDPELHNSKILQQDFHIAGGRVGSVLHNYTQELSTKFSKVLIITPANLRPAIGSMLLHWAGKSVTNCAARECEVVVLDNKTAASFLEIYHLQGGCLSPHNYGLMHKGELVAVMGFNSGAAVRSMASYHLLQRFATKGSVPGAASRLLAAFRKEHPGTIITYSDTAYSFGHLYDTLGFAKAPGNYPCDYSYYKDGKVIQKAMAQKSRLLKVLMEQNKPGSMEETETVLAERAGYLRFYLPPKQKWILP